MLARCPVLGLLLLTARLPQDWHGLDAPDRQYVKERHKLTGMR